MLAPMTKALSLLSSKPFPGKAFIKTGSRFFVKVNLTFSIFFQWIIQLFTGKAFANPAF